jgi:dTDP-4-dehydrorhamnose reductase
MLGAELSRLLTQAEIPFTGTDHDVDITDLGAVRSFANGLHAKTPLAWVINCAAYTAVDAAEDNVEVCRRLNTDGPANIATVCAKTGARLIHVSTDYVFNGKGSRPYTEEDAADPIGVYGLTKREGEQFALQNNDRTYIIRTAWMYGLYGKNFVTTMLKLMNERDTVTVVDDQRGSPTWARDLALAMYGIIGKNKVGGAIPYGIYHYTDEGNISWYDFAREIYRLGRELGIITKDCEVKPCTSAEFPSKVTRPAYSVLDKAKINKALSVPSWTESLQSFLADYKQAGAA